MITPGSNVQIIPANRLKCHACDSQTDANCQNEQTTDIVPCRTFRQPEQCVKVLYSDGRGEFYKI
jgi:hypothetical protein